MTPMLCSRFLKTGAGHKGSKTGIFWQAIEGGYGAILAWSLRHRWAVVAATLGIVAATPVIFSMVGKDFIPRDDQSEFEMALTLPEGYSLERADETCAELEQRLKQLRGVTHTFTVIGDTTGRVTKGQGDVTAASIYVPRPACRRARRFGFPRHWLPPSDGGPQPSRPGHGQAPAIFGRDHRLDAAAGLLRGRGHQPLAAFPSRPSRPRPTCWSAASRSANTRSSTSNTTSGCAPSARPATMKTPSPG
jgi:hypothetical protein